MPAKKKPEMITEQTIEEEQQAMQEAVRKVRLLTIGFIALAFDEIETLFNRMVDRGEIAEQDGRRLLHETMDQRRVSASKAGEEVSKRIEGAMNQAPLASKADLATLDEKLAQISAKLDTLSKSEPKQG